MIGALEGKQNVMQISQRMVKSFCEILSMGDRLDFPTSSEMTNSGVRVSFRKNEDMSQPKGLIVTAATSPWLPLSFDTVFNFFKDDKTRTQVSIFPLIFFLIFKIFDLMTVVDLMILVHCSLSLVCS